MKALLKILPWCCLALFGCEVVVVMLPKKDGEFHVREFGRLPVLLNGRVQPFDSVARNSLLQIRSTGDVPLEEVPSWQFWHHPKKLKSTEWLLELMTRPEVADTRPVFLIHHAELLGELKIEEQGVSKSGLRYYTFDQLKPVYDEIMEQGRQADKVEAEKRDTFQKQAAKLANAVVLYQRLKLTLQPEGVDDFPKQIKEFQRKLGPAQAAAKVSETDTNFNKQAFAGIADTMKDFDEMARFAMPLVVPPMERQKTPEGWQTAGSYLLSLARVNELHPAMAHLAAISSSYRQQDAPVFNREVGEYRSWLEQQGFGRELLKGKAEFYFNDVKPFLHAIIIYVSAFILAAFGILCLSYTPAVSRSLCRSAFYLIVLAAAVHTFGLVFRMILEGRPPVTNLYSSAIFIGWAITLLGIVLERIYRLGIGSLVAALSGFVTLLIAQNLALGGDTMEMLRAVLDTNFWLATHVVTVTIGYAAAFCAGLLAVLYIFLGVFTPLLKHRLVTADTAAAVDSTSRAGRSSQAAPPDSRSGSEIEVGKALSKMVYAIVCFATLFSFIGTVLGGIWADQSWGRFWGWDPKENGALLIVIWNAIILHSRWGGLVRERGIMNLAVFGNIVTSFSWFGVNMLGIGLHSYGFMDEGFRWLMIFMGSQGVVIALGLLPLDYWRSFRKETPPPVPPKVRGRSPAAAAS